MTNTAFHLNLTGSCDCQNVNLLKDKCNNTEGKKLPFPQMMSFYSVDLQCFGVNWNTYSWYNINVTLFLISVQ